MRDRILTKLDTSGAGRSNGPSTATFGSGLKAFGNVARKAQLYTTAGLTAPLNYNVPESEYSLFHPDGRVTSYDYHPMYDANAVAAGWSPVPMPDMSDVAQRYIDQQGWGRETNYIDLQGYERVPMSSEVFLNQAVDLGLEG